tara:strand:- start:2751 stop:2999 length:249 start_codon:yes stop_codon:yes gene_type:complete
LLFIDISIIWLIKLIILRKLNNHILIGAPEDSSLLSQKNLVFVVNIVELEGWILKEIREIYFGLVNIDFSSKINVYIFGIKK